MEIKDELKKTSINITCYDRNGEIVKRVTSTDDGDVEDPDNEGNDPNGGGDTPSGGNTSGSGTNTNRQYTISVSSADSNQGTVTGVGTYSEGSRVNVTATPKSGYAFDKWSDGNTSASRTINVSQNLTLTASFKVADSTENPGGSSDDDTPDYI